MINDRSLFVAQRGVSAAVARLALLWLSSCTLGCDSSVKRSADAVALPAVSSDASERQTDDDTSTSDWPGWRGPDVAGISTDRNLPTTFGPHEGVCWVAKLPGPGNSSATIWQDRVFLTAAVGGSPARLAVIALDRKTGKQL